MNESDIGIDHVEDENTMAENVNQLKNMIMSFRVAELNLLLSYAGKAKSGKKNELQATALELLKGRQLTLGIANKIKELHKLRFNHSNYLSGTSVSHNNNNAIDLNMSVNSGRTTRSAASASAMAQHNRQHSHSQHQQHNSSSQSHAMNKHLVPIHSHSHPHSHSHSRHPQAQEYYSMPRLDQFSSKTYHHPSHSVAQSSPQTSHSAQMQYPVYPDVKFKHLPFYDVIGELLKPSSLNPTQASRFQESTFTFHLTPQQANSIAMSRDVQPGMKIEYSTQIQLRFCLLETSCDQEDNFPPSICVKVNSKLCPLPNPLPTNKPGVEPKRPSRPVNITSLCRHSPTVSNQLSISWASEYGRPYAVGVYCVKKLTSQELLERIRKKGIRNSDHTRAMIKEKLSHDPDSEIATMSLRGSLLCPLGKMRIQLPCRATTCNHVQCFDALLYLQMNEKKPTWLCPVCDKSANFKDLSIDGMFSEIINQAPASCSEVQFYADGSWTPVIAKKDNFESVSSPSTRKANAKRSATSPEPEDPKRKKIDVITIDSSDDEADEDDDTSKDTDTCVIPTTPVLSSGSGSSSESDTPTHPLSLPSPDSPSSSNTSFGIPTTEHSVSSAQYSTHVSGVPTYARSGSTSTSTSPYNRSTYPSMPSTLINPSATPYYSTTATTNNYQNQITDYFSSTSTGSSSNLYYPNFDIGSALDQMFRQGDYSSNSREGNNNRNNFSSSTNNSSRNRPDYDPDVISID